MYRLIKAIGHIVTYFICAITIDKIDVTESIFLNYFIISPIINELMWIASYLTCNKIIYQKLNIPEVGSIGYTISYVIYTIILFSILILLKRFNMLPFANDFDARFLNYIEERFSNIIIEFSNKIVNVLITTNS